MKINLTVGTFLGNPGLNIIFRQEGISFKKISANKKISSKKFPVVAFSQSDSWINDSIIRDYVSEGGALLTTAENYANVFQDKLRKKRVKYLLPEKHSIFSDIGLIDIYGEIFYSCSHKCSKLDKDLFVYQKKYGKGIILIIPFLINELITSHTSKRKKFYAKRKELPSEIVSVISKSKVREIVCRSLEYLFHFQDLPFIRKWYYPNENRKTFLFRIDTDICSQSNARKMNELFQKYGINSTWFVDTDSEERLRNFYAKISGEVTLHCREHKVYKQYRKNYDNLTKGIERLEKAGIKKTGFAAPFGEWNPDFGRALTDLNFQYSSEFALDYNDFPFFPYFNNEYSDLLQIPIHPICPGRLRRSHFSINEMVQYFKRVLEEKVSNAEPVIFYHHPEQQMFEVFDDIFYHIANHDFWNPTFAEFCDWWKSRDRIEFTPVYSDGRIFLSNHEKKYYVKITNSQNRCKILQATSRIELDELGFEGRSHRKIPPDLERIRSFCWRDLLYDYESWRTKQKL